MVTWAPRYMLLRNELARHSSDRGVMRLGVHLPLVDFGHGVLSGAELRSYTAVAARAGFATVSANDHLLWRRPWLDGLTSLASVIGDAGGMTLATSVALPAVRHPVVLAKTLASLAVLTDSQVIAALGPGSSAADYDAVGVPFAQRWARFDEGLRLVRALLNGEPPEPGRFYAVADLRLDPLPDRPPQVWFGSWGSDVRLQRMAGASDGWLASAYNTTPERFAEARARLDGHLASAGRDPAVFPDLVATMWLYVTNERSRARDLLHDVMAPLFGRDPDELGARLPIGPAEHCIELLERYTAAGAQQVLLWPIHEPTEQLEIVADRVMPHLAVR